MQFQLGGEKGRGPRGKRGAQPSRPQKASQTPQTTPNTHTTTTAGRPQKKRKRGRQPPNTPNPPPGGHKSPSPARAGGNPKQRTPHPGKLQQPKGPWGYNCCSLTRLSWRSPLAAKLQRVDQLQGKAASAARGSPIPHRRASGIPARGCNRRMRSGPGGTAPRSSHQLHARGRVIFTTDAPVQLVSGKSNPGGGDQPLVGRRNVDNY